MGIDIDPLETIEELREDSARDKRNERLNGFVAVTVAILATFLGIFNVKDDNIVQAMLAEQAKMIDYWNFYQARNIREEIGLATMELIALERGVRPEGERAAFDASLAKYQAFTQSQNTKKEELKAQAEQATANYDKLNYRDDQFDLSEASMAIAIALLAITALTHFWWLYWVAMIPSVFGLAIGLAGLFGLPFHPDFLIHPLT
ncbi:MAG TPA: DUF4337 domain-containing protein [Caldimonas sp.]|jgi:hypothetical protein|nr:DUF4337 domain-containing protein [Caldimonas sp.]HEX2542528.1 DUF4337 domain-containing protein [Caldimonas sp.]